MKRISVQEKGGELYCPETVRGIDCVCPVCVCVCVCVCWIFSVNCCVSASVSAEKINWSLCPASSWNPIHRLIQKLHVSLSIIS